MPAASSTIRTVPGGKVWPEPDGDDVAPADGSGMAPLLPGRQINSPTTTTTTSPSTPRTRSGRRRADIPGRGSGPESKTSGGRSGASTGAVRTATPGPAGVVRSDQPTPFHQRT